MRAAAFSSFRKLYRLIDHSSSATTGTAAAAADSEEETEDAVGGELFANGLPAGNYTLTVGYGTFYFFIFSVRYMIRYCPSVTNQCFSSKTQGL